MGGLRMMTAFFFPAFSVESFFTCFFVEDFFEPEEDGIFVSKFQFLLSIHNQTNTKELLCKTITIRDDRATSLLLVSQFQT